MAVVLWENFEMIRYMCPFVLRDFPNLHKLKKQSNIFVMKNVLAASKVLDTSPLSETLKDVLHVESINQMCLVHQRKRR